ncbi:Rgg/GadR/MutR family transcriptional regulator [Limosilactobacillus allomucosae]|uniref:Rgg/GadR/MutR family transcriptional regulator n=1 Tax=Limosilactobacillus allomucosae TaxID=3142938 RepID=UPI00326438F7
MELDMWGSTLSSIRKSKNIPINEVIGDHLTRSAYSRFASGKTNTSVDNFAYMLNNLHINFEEFNYIKNQYEPDKYQALLKKAQIATHQHDLAQLEEIMNKFKSYAEITSETEPLHLYCIVKLTIDRLSKMPYDAKAKKIITTYLTKCETWSHYEILLFNNVMFIFDLELINIMKKRVLHNLEKYQNLRSYGSESFRVLINIFTLFLDNKQIKEALILDNEIDEFPLRADMFFEQTLKMYFKGVLNLIQTKNQQNEDLVMSLQILKTLSEKDYYISFSAYLSQIKQIYELD